MGSEATADESRVRTFKVIDGGARSEEVAVASLRKALDALSDGWESAKRCEPFQTMPAWTKSGLILGAGTVLAREVPGNEERILALLSVAFDKVLAPVVASTLERAHAAWRGGHIAESSSRIASAGFPPLFSEDSARRLYIAAGLVDGGFISPLGLSKICQDVANQCESVRKFDPEQPRVPAGNSGGGQWTSDNGQTTSDGAAGVVEQAVTILRTCEGAAQACTSR